MVEMGLRKKSLLLSGAVPTIQSLATNSAEKVLLILFTAPFNNMRTLKFEAQPTNGFFAAVNQVFGGSS